jgi:NADH:ubiquinone oxidoreductase subunit D
MTKRPNGTLYFYNLGPHHPSTHGVLRIITIVEGENLIWLQPEIGLLHRGTEKLIELRN